MQFSYFPLSMQFFKMYFQCFFCTFGFMLICLCKLPFIFFLQRLFFHFYFIHEYFTCILTWILFSFSYNYSIFQFSQKNATQRVEAKRKLYDLTNLINLEKSKCKKLQNKVLTFLSSPHCEKMQIFSYNANEMEMFSFF